MGELATLKLFSLAVRSRTSHDVQGDQEERAGVADEAWRGVAGKKFQISEPWGVWILADSVREEFNVRGGGAGAGG